MSRALKAAVLAAMVGSCGVLLPGCESLNFTGDAQPAMQVQSADAETPTATRQRVIAELREAQRLGLITVGEEDVPQYTAEQSRLVAAAGAAASDPAMAKK